MATRRTRIKGIANIPQRRKTAPENNEEIEPEKNDVEHNLNVEIPMRSNEEAPSEITDETGGSEPPPPIETKVSEAKPTVPQRRKFIKPAVAVNAISRKLKLVEGDKTPPVTQPLNGKIVILDQAITFPEQDKNVVINKLQLEQEPFEKLLQGPQIDDVKSEDIVKSPDPNIGNIKLLERDIRRLTPTTLPEPDYPIPPPSPNKINRSRIKAVPRLGQRHHSFSASESEDESKRNHHQQQQQQRHRNDSVCSSVSGLQDMVPECPPSPQKAPREFNSVIQRKCRRTEQSRKLAEARREFLEKFGNGKPDRRKLTMIDLIFYNPVTNPMSGEGRRRRRTTEQSGTTELSSQHPPEIQETSKPSEEEEAIDDPTKSDEENEIPAPQIKIGPQGELVVDEQSLVIENKAVKRGREEIAKGEVVNGDFETGYGIYKRAKRSKDWNKMETLKFYKALNTIGTDFTLMCELFPRRSRRELKMKFKKEERVNRALVDKAIMQPCAFDFNDFKHEVDMEEKELQELERMKERQKEIRLEAKKRKAEQSEKQPKPKPKKSTMDILDVLEDDSDADESDLESIDSRDSSLIVPSIQKPTRSGRVPKMRERYTCEPEPKTLNSTPGSLIVMASTGPSGQPVYKVCMVTDDKEKRQIGEDMNSLQKALEWKDKGLTDLFTLSAAEIHEENVTIAHEENNVTIPAGEELSCDV